MRLPILATLALLACASREAPPPAPLAVARQVTRPEAVRAAEPAAPVGSECKTDADCATTRVPEGACCPSLCEPRAVPAKRAAALEAAISTCRPACTQPQCAPARTHAAACVSGACVARQESMQ